MNTHADKRQENKSQSAAYADSQKKSCGEATFQFIDNRPEAITQRKLQEIANNSPQAQLQVTDNNYDEQQQQSIQKRENNTGLPDNLKSGIENLSGYSMDDVKVHYNSDKPAKLLAHAYAQGTDIHMGSGQEKHLPHEAWHVVQQKRGKVKPSTQLKGKVAINEDSGHEAEANKMGAEALKHGDENVTVSTETQSLNGDATQLSSKVVQRLIRVSPVDVDPVTGPVHSTFTAVEFGAAIAALPGTNAGAFWNATGQATNNPSRANLNYAFVNAVLMAPFADIPALAVGVVNAISGGNVGINGRLGVHIADLEYALGQQAPTTAGGPDIAHFRQFRAGGAIMSRTKGNPNTIAVGSLIGLLATAGAALTARHGIISAKNTQLDAVANYIAGRALWYPRHRANYGMAGIRSGHENGAGWLPAVVAAPPEAALFAAILLRGTQRAGVVGNARRAAIGAYIVARHGARADSSEVEDDIDGYVTTPNIDARELQEYFYRYIFWPASGNRNNRVQIAWARYGTDNSGIANCAYIEFNGGGAASRIIWDYVNDEFYLSAHYNWVDGFNSFFQITGLAPTY